MPTYTRVTHGSKTFNWALSHHLVALQQPEEVPGRHGHGAPLREGAADAEVLTHAEVRLGLGAMEGP